jgi:hypothetical protein
VRACVSCTHTCVCVDVRAVPAYTLLCMCVPVCLYMCMCKHTHACVRACVHTPLSTAVALFVVCDDI